MSKYYQEYEAITRTPRYQSLSPEDQYKVDDHYSTLVKDEEWKTVSESDKFNSLSGEEKNKVLDHYGKTEAEYNLESRGDIERGLRRGGRQTAAVLSGAAGLVADAIDNEPAKEYFFDKYKENIEEAQKNPPSVSRIEDIEGFGGAVDWLQGIVGEQVPMLATMAVTGGLGAAAGKKVLSSAAKKAIEKQVASGVSRSVAEKIVAEKLASLTAKAGVIAGSGAMESGGMWGEDAAKNGLENANTGSAAVLGGISGLTEIVSPVGRVASMVGGGRFAKEAAGPLLKRLGIEIPKSMGGEFSQEATQELLGKINEKINDPTVSLTDKEAISQYLNAGAAGAVIGGAISPVGTSIDYLREDKKVPQKTSEDILQSQSLDEALGNFEKSIVSPAIDESISRIGASVKEATEQINPSKISPANQAPPPVGTLPLGAQESSSQPVWQENYDENAVDPNAIVEPQPILPPDNENLQPKEGGLSGGADILEDEKTRLDSLASEVPLPAEITTDKESLSVQGKPSTAEEAAAVFSEMPENDVEKRVKKQGELEDTFNSVPAYMTEDDIKKRGVELLYNSMPRQGEAVSKPATRTAFEDQKTPYEGKTAQESIEGAVNPEWLKQKAIDAYNDSLGIEKGSKDRVRVNSSIVRSVITAIKKGKTLTPRQQEVLTYMEYAGSQLPELAQEVAFNRLENKGYELGAEQEIHVGDLQEGDKVVSMDEFGNPVEYTHSGFDKETGDAILKDHKTIFADDFEPLNIVASKIAPKAELSTVSEIDNIDDTGKAINNSGDVKPEVYQLPVELNPTEAQKESENYKKAHVRFDGMKITVENPVGSERSGTDQKGKKWKISLKNDYGYIRGSVGFDKDHVDAFFANGYQGGADKVFIVNQYNKDGSFDEHKAIFGVDNKVAARRLYNSNHEKGWKGGKDVAEMSMEQFKKWVMSDSPKKGPAVDVKLKPQESTNAKQQPTAPDTGQPVLEGVQPVLPGGSENIQPEVQGAQKSVPKKDEGGQENTAGKEVQGGANAVAQGKQESSNGQATVKQTVAPQVASRAMESSRSISFAALYNSGKIGAAARNISKSQNRKEINRKLDLIFGASSKEDNDVPADGNYTPMFDIAADYRADIEYAANARDWQEVKELLNAVQEEQRDIESGNWEAERNRDIQPTSEIQVEEERTIITRKDGKPFKTERALFAGMKRYGLNVDKYSTERRDDGFIGVKAKDGKGDISFSRSPSPTFSPADIQSEATALLGTRGLQNLTRRGVMEIVSPEEAEMVLSLASGEKYSKEEVASYPIFPEDGSRIEGYYLSGKIHIVEGNVAAGKVRGLLLHEIGIHMKSAGFTNERSFQSTLSMLERRSKLNSKEGAAIRKAMERVPADTAQENYLEEVAAYLISDSPEIGIVRQIIAQVKRFLVDKMGFTPDMLKNIDIQALAVSVLSKEAKIEPGDLARSGKTDSVKMSKAESIMSSITDLKNKWKDKFETLSINERENGDINLGNVVAIKSERGRGLGSNFMGDLILYADHSGKRIVLSPGTKGDASGTTSRARLVKFYKMFGFVENKGENKDYSLSEGMYRPTNPDIRYSVAQATSDLEESDSNIIKESFSPFVGTRDFITRSMENADPKWQDRWERLLYNMTDINDPRKRVMNRAGKQSAATDILTVERLRGKVTADEVEQFMNKKVDPILKELAEGKVNIKEFEEYKYALHVPERNLQMRRVNAKRYIDNLLKQMPDKEAREWKSKLMTVRSDALMGHKELTEKHDEYLKVMENIFSDIQARETELDARQSDHDNRAWTDEEIEKGTDAFLQKRLDNSRKRISYTKKIESDWSERSVKFAGITDEESESIIDKWKNDPRIKAMESASKKLDAINADKLKILYSSGQISKEEYESVSNLWKHYVPLYRDGFDDSMPSTGRVTGPTGKPLKVAKGSMREVVNIFAHTVQNYQTAVNRKHKAIAGAVLYNFVLENEDCGITIEEGEKKPTHDKEGNLVMYTDHDEPDNGIFVRVDGERYTLVFGTDTRTDKGRTLARFLDSIKNADAGLGSTLRFLTSVNRKLAMINTMLSPEFIISNFARDAQTAGIHLEETKAKGLQKKIFKEIFPAIKGIFQAEYGKEDSEMSKWYRDFAKHGGKIGWLQGYEDIQDLANELKSAMELHEEGHAIKKKFKAIGDLVSRSNMAVENGVRLAVYKNLVEGGESKAQAALVASNLTVDFTRRGKMGPVLNALYMFANAGIQGNVRMIKAFSNSGKVRKIVGGIVGAGFSMHLLALAMGGDDDDGDPYINDIDEFEKERNIIIMIPGSKGHYIKIPMLYGYNGFFNLGAEFGDMVASLASGREYSLAKGAMRITSTFANSFNPLQAATVLQTLSPTITDPVVQAYENKTWSGGDLMPAQNTFGPPKPDSERFWNSARTPSKFIAKELNSLSGGDTYEPGLIDVSPETLDMLYDTATGSLGRFVSNTLSLPFNVFSEDDLRINKVPFVRRFVGEQSEYAVSKKYREKVKQIELFKQKYDDFEGKPEQRELKRDPLYKTLSPSKEYNKKIDRISKSRRLAEANGDERMVKFYDDRIRVLQSSFLKRIK